jgi:rod shape-determining protein MreD
MPRVLLWLGLSVLLSLAHLLIVRWIGIAGVTPDLLLILVVWITLSTGQLPGTIAGFLVGLLMDGLTGDVLGTNALSKTAAAFVAGYFYNENKVALTLGHYPALLITLLCAVIHNVIYYFFHVRYAEMTMNTFITKYGVASALYTTVLAIVPMLITARRADRIRY